MHFLYVITLFVSIVTIGDKQSTDNGLFIVKGRSLHPDKGDITLIGPGSSVTFSFTGNSCNVMLQAKDSYEDHNFAVLELNGKYLGRIKIGTAMKRYSVDVPAGNKTNILTVYKATEAANGMLVFGGTNAKVIKTEAKSVKKIEFIGDSITCGMGSDTKEIPCGTGQWYDQHNAYLAYGPVAARLLGADFLLSSVSGIGMYRNWNDEHAQEPIMPDVYGNLYLNKDSSKPYGHDYFPDVTCIALGTNDFSEGDGKKVRLPFDAKKYTANYIAFVKMLYNHSPNTKIVLLNSPMVDGEKNRLFVECLRQVKEAFPDKDIRIFEFSSVIPHGCTYHPDNNDHQLMANQLAPFLKNIL